MSDPIDRLDGEALLAEARRRILHEEDNRGNPSAWMAASSAWFRLRELGREADFERIRAEVKAERDQRDRHNAAQAARLRGDTP